MKLVLHFRKFIPLFLKRTFFWKVMIGIGLLLEFLGSYTGVRGFFQIVIEICHQIQIRKFEEQKG